MSGKSNYLENLVLNWALNATDMPSAPAAIFVGLHQGDPTDAGTGGTEVTASIRAAGRVAASFGAPSDVSGPNVAENDAIVDFGDADNTVTGITHFSIWDDADPGEGNMLYSAALPSSVDIGAGTLVSFPVGELVISED